MLFLLMFIPVKVFGHLLTKSLHLEALSWEAGGKASTLTTQESENRAPTCHKNKELANTQYMHTLILRHVTTDYSDGGRKNGHNSQ